MGLNLPAVMPGTIDKDHPTSKLTTMADGAEAVVCWTNYMSHHHENAVRDKAKLVRVAGGIGHIKEKLLELACQ